MKSEIQRGRAQTIRGVVISDKMDKTVVIAVGRTIRHSLYHKSLRRRSHFFVHDENKTAKVGDKVVAVACKPLSRHKNFRLLKVLEKRAVQ